MGLGFRGYIKFMKSFGRMGIAVVGDGRWDARLTCGSDMPSEIYKMNLTPPSHGAV